MEPAADTVSFHPPSLGVFLCPRCCPLSLRPQPLTAQGCPLPSGRTDGSFPVETGRYLCVQVSVW